MIDFTENNKNIEIKDSKTKGFLIKLINFRK